VTVRIGTPPVAGGCEAAPDADRMSEWLRSPDVVRPDGAVLSWWNPAHPGYPYPEAAGLWLSNACATGQPGRPDALADRVAARLCRDAAEAGGAGRDGAVYLFDSAVALAGLLAYRSGGGVLDVAPAAAALHAFVAAGIERRAGCLPAARGRWSVDFSPHLLKAAKAAYAYDRAFGARSAGTLVPALASLAADVRPGSGPLYVHAHCYAIEGALLLRSAGVRGLPDPAVEVARLARFQRPDGAMPAYILDDRPAGAARSDATAQAVRLWCLLDPVAFAGPIRRGLAHLAACQSPAGGLLYEPRGDDVNTWSTLFALQAVRWARSRGRIEDVL